MTARLLKAVIESAPKKPSSDNGKQKALAWARVSTDMQEERGLSMPEQLRQVREYAEEKGIEILDEYSEAASAYRPGARRPEFDRMLQRAKDDPEVTLILVRDFSRFSRDSLRCRTLIQSLREAGVEVTSLSDPMFDPDTVPGVYMEAITFAKNEAYSKEIAFHTREGCKANIQMRDQETGWCYKNGGQPLWGYRAQRLDRGGTPGRPIFKSIWVLDDSIVSGRPVHEWVREGLRLAAAGATIDELRDFCNQNGLPAPRKRYWGSSTWYALLQPDVLLKYAGYGIWNVHRKNGTKRPPQEWVIAERAHEPMISEDLAQEILTRRQQASKKGFCRPRNRSYSSPYLLSGGLFKCGRCDANMTGFKATGGFTYYVCGSSSYRNGLGCGKGVYVPQDHVEGAVLKGIQRILDRLNQKKFTRMVNEEVNKLWESQNGATEAWEKQVRTIDAKIANIRQAIEDGLSDAAWANERLRELESEKTSLQRPAFPTRPPKLDEREVARYRSNLSEVFEQAQPRERKELIGILVEEIKLAPETRSVDITYRAPEHFMNKLVAGTLYGAIHNILGDRLRKIIPLPRNGRRPSRKSPEHRHTPLNPKPNNELLVAIVDCVLAR